MEFTRHTAEDGTVTVTADHFDDEATISLAAIAASDPQFIDVGWVGVAVTILGVGYRITGVDHATGVATITKES